MQIFVSDEGGSSWLYQSSLDFVKKNLRSTLKSTRHSTVTWMSGNTIRVCKSCVTKNFCTQKTILPTIFCWNVTLPDVPVKTVVLYKQNKSGRVAVGFYMNQITFEMNLNDSNLHMYPVLKWTSCMWLQAVFFNLR